MPGGIRQPAEVGQGQVSEAEVGIGSPRAGEAGVHEQRPFQVRGIEVGAGQVDPLQPRSRQDRLARRRPGQPLVREVQLRDAGERRPARLAPVGVEPTVDAREVAVALALGHGDLAHVAAVGQPLQHQPVGLDLGLGRNIAADLGLDLLVRAPCAAELPPLVVGCHPVVGQSHEVDPVDPDGMPDVGRDLRAVEEGAESRGLEALRMHGGNGDERRPEEGHHRARRAQVPERPAGAALRGMHRTGGLCRPGLDGELAPGVEPGLGADDEHDRQGCEGRAGHEPVAREQRGVPGPEHHRRRREPDRDHRHQAAQEAGAAARARSRPSG